MPLVQYACLHCGRDFESLVWKPAEARDAKCPGCGSVETERKMSRFASVSGGGADCAPSGGSMRQGAAVGRKKWRGYL